MLSRQKNHLVFKGFFLVILCFTNLKNSNLKKKKNQELSNNRKIKTIKNVTFTNNQN